MNWARTLMLAEMLTKAIQANVAREARPAKSRRAQEIPMNDTVANPVDATPLDTSPAPADAAAPDASAVAAPPDSGSTAPTDPTASPAEETSVAPATTSDTSNTPVADPATTPAAEAPAASAPAHNFDIIDARLERIANLVKTLNENPAVHALLCTLMGSGGNKGNKTS